MWGSEATTVKECKGIGRMSRNESVWKGGRTGKAVTEPVQQRGKRELAKMGVNQINKVTHTYTGELIWVLKGPKWESQTKEGEGSWSINTPVCFSVSSTVLFPCLKNFS